MLYLRCIFHIHNLSYHHFLAVVCSWSMRVSRDMGRPNASTILREALLEINCSGIGWTRAIGKHCWLGKGSLPQFWWSGKSCCWICRTDEWKVLTVKGLCNVWVLVGWSFGGVCGGGYIGKKTQQHHWFDDDTRAKWISRLLWYCPFSSFVGSGSSCNTPSPSRNSLKSSFLLHAVAWVHDTNWTSYLCMPTHQYTKLLRTLAIINIQHAIRLNIQQSSKWRTGR